METSRKTYTVLNLETTNKDNIIKQNVKTHNKILRDFTKIILLELDKLQANSHATIIISNKIHRLINSNITFRQYIETFRSKLYSAFNNSYKKETSVNKNIVDVRRHLKVMDSECENYILRKISPIKNKSGKCVIDLEEVFRDLLLVKKSLYSVFNKIDKNESKYKILEEFSRVQAEGEVSEDLLDNIANQYRVLLNNILRFHLEVKQLISEQIQSKHSNDNKELLRLRLEKAELEEKLREQNRRLALFVDEKTFN